MCGSSLWLGRCATGAARWAATTGAAKKPAAGASPAAASRAAPKARPVAAAASAAAAAAATAKTAGHYSFGKAKHTTTPIGQQQHRPAPTSGDDPRAKAKSRVMYDPSGKTPTFETSRVEQMQEGANRYFDRVSANDPWLYYIKDNFNGMCLYQLLLEQGLTVVFMMLLAGGLLTAEGVDDFVRSALFGHEMELTTHSVWEDHVYLVGSAKAKDDPTRLYIPKELLTLYSQAHQMSWYLMPLQLPFVYFTYGRVAPLFGVVPARRMLERATKSKDILDARYKAMKPPGNFHIC